MKAIHQFVAGFTEGDAISNEARVMRDIFRSWGHDARIFSEAKRIPRELVKEAGDVSECAKSVGPDDVVLLHLSIGSPVNDVFTQLNCRKAILYHNVTPPDFFKGVQEQTRNNLRKGCEQVKQLAGAAEVNLADSAYNAAEIEAHGYQDVKVLPLVLNFDRLTESVCKKTMRRFDDGKTNILFVGRCAPNKRLEDLVSAFYYVQKYVEPESRFIHVGSFAGTERYKAVLQTHVRDLRINDFVFVGAVRQPILNACYKSARAFLCMSEHEGFCIPVIESMVMGVPVLAYEAAAVPETMDGAGVCFAEKQFDQVAEMTGQLAKDGPLREGILAGQRERVDRYRARKLDEELREHLKPLL